VCLAIAFAIAYGDILDALAERERGGAALPFAIVLGAFVTELFLLVPIPVSKPLWQQRAAPIAQLLRHHEGVGSVFDPSQLAKLNQMEHEKALTGGWLPRANQQGVAREQAARRRFSQLGSGPQRERFLQELGVDALLLDSQTALVHTRASEGSQGPEFRVLRASPRESEKP
jgi:hypothetical protein